MNFGFKNEIQGTDQILYFFGRIDETANFEALPIEAHKRLVIDLAEVQTLNSLGLKSWVVWVKGLKRPEGIFLRNCPPLVVHQMNILDGFLPLNAVVESFLVPYHCEKCQADFMYKAIRGKDFMEATVDTKERLSVPEEQKCPNCGENTQVDVVANQYFYFLKRRPSFRAAN